MYLIKVDFKLNLKLDRFELVSHHIEHFKIVIGARELNS